MFDSIQFMMGFSKCHGVLRAMDEYSVSAKVQHQPLAVNHKVGRYLQKTTQICFKVQNRLAIDTSRILGSIESNTEGRIGTMETSTYSKLIIYLRNESG